VYDGITATTRKESQFVLYCNVRMIQMCISFLNRLFQFYIGLNLRELIEKSIINNNIENILSVLVSKNVITNYHFTLEPNYQEGTLIVNLDMITNFMTKSVKINSIINIESEE
jgi:hypothetical protein